MALKYRPEIDGLRSIAVAAVILYHANFCLKKISFFKGGFIGVDIFFVISGYLITSIILREMATENFSFMKFYERRARRILPALFTVIIATIPFSWFYMLPSAVKAYSKSILSALIFSSNFWFWREDSYWGEASTLKPFLHTWSLSVEEQFYLIFPVFLLLLWKYTKNHILTIFVILFLLSLQLVNFGSTHFSEANFFLIHTRSWELIAGSILAKIELDKERISHPFLDLIMPAVGLFLICNAILFFDDKMLHPSFMTFLPVLGTMLLIWFCKKGELVTNILGSKPFVSVGLISYSLYLWHYPVFAFFRISSNIASNPEKIGWIILSILLSILTYFLIEKPFRKSTKVSLRSLIIFLSFCVITIVLILGYAIKNYGFWRHVEPWQYRIMAPDSNNLNSLAEYVNKEYSKLNGKAFSSDGTKKRLLIIGDSYSQDFFNILKEADLLKRLDVSTHYISVICRNVPETSNWSMFIDPINIAKCKDAIRIGNAHLNKYLSQADFIIVASAWDEFTSSELKNLCSEIKKHSRAAFFIIGTKNFYIPKISEVFASQDINIFIKMKKDSGIYHIIEKTRKIMMGDNHYFDLHRLICGDSQKCPVTTPYGDLISYDGSHLTKQGATYIGQLLIKDQNFMKKWNSVFKE